MSKLLEDRGPHGLYAVLAEMNLCTSINTLYGAEIGMAFYVIICTLTDFGVTHIFYILNLIFQVNKFFSRQLIRLCDKLSLALSDFSSSIYIFCALRVFKSGFSMNTKNWMK